MGDIHKITTTKYEVMPGSKIYIVCGLYQNKPSYRTQLLFFKNSLIFTKSIIWRKYWKIWMSLANILGPWQDVSDEIQTISIY